LKANLGIIILNWHAADDTIDCVRKVTTWKQLLPAIWVVDNGSRDGSAEMIAQTCPHIHLIRNKENQGFAGGNNVGIVAALAAGVDYLLLLNNDAFINEENILRLLNTLQANENIGVIGPLLFNAADEEQLIAAGGRDPVLHHRSHICELPPGPPIRAVDYVPGTALIGRAEVFRTVGLLDDDYFFNVEVADLCKRARQHGYITAIDTRARAFHAIDRRPSHQRNTLYVYYFVRNRFIYIRKFYTYLQQISLICFWGIYNLALCAKLRARGHPATAKAVRLGLIDGLRGRSGEQDPSVFAE
jgi:GT2 family glycosyltransferase